MAKGQLDAVIGHIRKVAAAYNARNLTDCQLLDQFSLHRDQTAFATLVKRHGPMVLGVCRHVLHHEQDAEDAFQATFLVLARNAASVRKKETLPGWLHGVAYRMAMSNKRAAARRRTHEGRAKTMPQTTPPSELALREMQAILDEEIQRLPEKYRAPFVMCFLEGQSGAEAARQLGLNEGTVRSRLSRARQQLRDRLSRRGVALSAVLAAAAVWPSPTTAAIPALVVESTVKAALAYAAGKTATGAISAQVAALAEGAIKNVLLAKCKSVTAILLCLSLAAGGTRAWIQRTLATQATAVQEPQTQTKATAKKPAPAKPGTDSPKVKPPIEDEGDTVAVHGQVLGPDGKPFAGARLYLTYSTHRQVKFPVRATSGEDGLFRFSYAKTDIADEEVITGRGDPWRVYVVCAWAPGYDSTWIWMPEIRNELTLQLVKADIPIKGRVLDLQGRPVVGAKVEAIGWHWFGVPKNIRTDKEGRFVVTGVGRDRTVELRISGPTIELKRVSVTVHSVMNGKPADHAWVEVVAGPTKPIEGIIRAKDTGKPLPGVMVYARTGDFMAIFIDQAGVQAMTDEQGRYRLVGLPKSSQYELAVYQGAGQAYLPAVKWVGDSEGLKPIPVDFGLRRGILVRFRLVDKETGKFVRGLVQYTITRDNPLWAEAVFPYPQGIILPPRVWFPGHVTNRDGIIEFVAYPGRGAIFANGNWGNPPYLKARLDPADEVKGYFPLTKGDPNNGFIYSMNGYKVIDTVKTDQVLTFDIEFSRGRNLQGKLLGPDDQPVTGATAYGVTFDASTLYPDMLRETPLVPQDLKTEAFTALGLYPKEPRTLSFVHNDRKLIGYVIVNGSENRPVTVRLESWGAITGRLVDDRGKLLAGVTVGLHYPELPRPGFQLRRVPQFKSDDQGRFRVEGLMPGLKHELTLSADSKMKVTLSTGEALMNLSAGAGEVKDLGDVRVKVVLVK